MMRKLRSAAAFKLFALTLAILSPSALAQERAWTLDAVGDDAFLVFGVPETDDVGLSFWCKLATAKVRVYIPDTAVAVKPNSETPVTLTVSDKTFTYQASTSINETSGGTSIEFEISTTDGLFGALKSADRVQTKVGGHTAIYPLFDADVEGLLSLCQK